MNLKSSLLSAVAGIGIAAVIGSTAIAAPVRVQDDPVLSGGSGAERFASPNLYSSISYSINSGSSFSGLNAGAFGLQQSAAAPLFDPSTFSSLITYCFEVGQFLSLPTTYESQSLVSALALNFPSSANAAQAAVKMARLWIERFTISVTESDTNFDFVAGATSGERAAAFQIAIWDIAVDNADGLGTGVFRTAGDTISRARINELAGKYLAIANDTSITTIANLDALYERDAQNLILPRGGSTPIGDPVPVPASLLLFGAGLVGLAALRRKNQA